MKKSLDKIFRGYHQFRKKYAHGNKSIMHFLSHYGQQPQIMVVACCDSRVDPALILQCDPGDLFVVRNVANIVPPYEIDDAHHGTSAALEFAVKVLKIKHLILLGHSQCGGIQALLNNTKENKNDFISHWVSIIKPNDHDLHDTDECAKSALKQSHHNCLGFPWVREKVAEETLKIHLWFFDIQSGKIFSYNETENTYIALD